MTFFTSNFSDKETLSPFVDHFRQHFTISRVRYSNSIRSPMSLITITPCWIQSVWKSGDADISPHTPFWRHGRWRRLSTSRELDIHPHDISPHIRKGLISWSLISSSKKLSLIIIWIYVCMILRWFYDMPFWRHSRWEHLSSSLRCSLRCEIDIHPLHDRIINIGD